MTIVDGGSAFSQYGLTPTGGRFAPITRTVTEVMKAVKRKFGDESGVQLEDADIMAWINDAQDVIVTKNKILKAKSVISTAAGVRNYLLPTEGIQQIESLLYNGQQLPNMSVAQAEESISQTDLNFEETGNPLFWFEWAGEITLWPTPVENGSLTLRYSMKPAPVTSPSSLLSVPDTYYQDVVTFVLKQAYEMDENESMMATKGAEFEASLANRIDEERTAQTMTYGVITIIDD